MQRESVILMCEGQGDFENAKAPVCVEFALMVYQSYREIHIAIAAPLSPQKINALLHQLWG